MVESCKQVPTEATELETLRIMQAQAEQIRDLQQQVAHWKSLATATTTVSTTALTALPPSVQPPAAGSAAASTSSALDALQKVRHELRRANELAAKLKTMLQKPEQESN